MGNPVSGFFGFLGRLFQSGSDRIVDPTYALDRAYAQQLQALEETRRGRLEIETISARLELEARQIGDGVAACEDQARRALLAGREDLARVSLSRREELDEQLARTQAERERLEEERQSLQRQESELAGAVQAWRAILQTDPDSAEAWRNLGDILEASEAWPDGVRYQVRKGTTQPAAVGCADSPTPPITSGIRTPASRTSTKRLPPCHCQGSAATCSPRTATFTRALLAATSPVVAAST